MQAQDMTWVTMPSHHDSDTWHGDMHQQVESAEHDSPLLLMVCHPKSTSLGNTRDVLLRVTVLLRGLVYHL